jgi:hypothetical protein
MSASGLVRQELLSGSTVVTSTSDQNIDYNAVPALSQGSLAFRSGPTSPLEDSTTRSGSELTDGDLSNPSAVALVDAVLDVQNKESAIARRNLSLESVAPQQPKGAQTQTDGTWVQLIP